MQIKKHGGERSERAAPRRVLRFAVSRVERALPQAQLLLSGLDCQCRGNHAQEHLGLGAFGEPLFCLTAGQDQGHPIVDRLHGAIGRGSEDTVAEPSP